MYQAHLRQAVSERLPWAVVGAGAETGWPSSSRSRPKWSRSSRLGAGGSWSASGSSSLPVWLSVMLAVSGSRSIPGRRSGRSRISTGGWRSGRARPSTGLARLSLTELAHLPAAAARAEVGEQELLAERLFSAGGLTATANTFGERDVVIAVAAAHGQGAQAGEVVDGGAAAA